MNIQQLQDWLLEHADDIHRFTDYEIKFASDDVMRTNLELHWFSDRDWSEPGYRFVSLGQDGTGGEVAAWLSPRRPDDAPIVFFGSEGGAGVVAASPLAFAQALAYGPILQEYEKDDLDAPSRLSLEGNWFLSGNDAGQVAAAKDALGRYRQSAEERLRPVPPFESLVKIPQTVQSEFHDWVTATQARVAERHAAEQRIAVERHRQRARDKASRYAALGRDLPADAGSLGDGHRFAGVCPSCGMATTLRLTIFEEFSFGLCIPCYFSNAW